MTHKVGIQALVFSPQSHAASLLSSDFLSLHPDFAIYLPRSNLNLSKFPFSHL
jgi:hypothetical protein